MVRSAQERSNGFYLSCAVWCACCIWLIWSDLGSIAFVGSVILAIWAFGLRDKFGGEDTSSAYSVFNSGGRSIPGGFTGEQLDRQLRGGMSRREEKDVSSIQKGGIDAPLTSTKSAAQLTAQDKLKRRSAAAEAAERRRKQQQQQNAETLMALSS